jgi:hypothetical protein
MFFTTDPIRTAVLRDTSEPLPIDLYDAWLFAAADASLALEAWRVAGQDAKAEAHAEYRAALDREGHAARVLELCLRP